MKTIQNAGDVNLRGKKYKLLRCRCCSMRDLRDDYDKKNIAKQIRDYKKGRID